MRRVPEREAARAAGERFYFTGKPCRNWHIVKRYTANGLCARCAVTNTLKSVAMRAEHPNRVTARAVGAIHYSTGILCKHGHDKRFVSNSICVQCSLNRCKRWNKARPGYEAAAARRRRAKDPTGHRAEVKRWDQKNPEKRREILSAWKAANIDYVRSRGIIYQNNRRARVAGNGGTYTIDDVETLRVRQDGVCAGCRKVTPLLEVDHVKPIARGGTNAPSNLQLLCRRCNASKGTRDMLEWAQEHGFLCTTWG